MSAAVIVIVDIPRPRRLIARPFVYCCFVARRLAFHAVNTLNIDPLNYNPKDNISGYAAVPRNMTCLAQAMKKAGYHTSFFGCGLQSTTVSRFF